VRNLTKSPLRRDLAKTSKLTEDMRHAERQMKTRDVPLTSGLSSSELDIVLVKLYGQGTRG
jgi:hypothetical protein